MTSTEFVQAVFIMDLRREPLINKKISLLQNNNTLNAVTALLVANQSVDIAS